MNKKMKYDQVQTGRCGNGKDEKGGKMKRVKMKILKDLNEGGNEKGEEEEGRELPRDFFDVEEREDKDKDKDKGKDVNKGNSSSGGGNNESGNNNNNDNIHNDNTNTNNNNNNDGDSEDSSSVSFKVNDEYEDEANIMIEYSTRIANIISTYKDKQQHKHKHNQPLHPSPNTNKLPNTFLSVKRAPPSPLSKAALLSEILN